MTEVLLVLVLAGAAALFLAYRKDTRALVELYRSDHLQHFSAMLGQCEWMTKMTEEGVKKVQSLSEQVIASRLPVPVVENGQGPEPWSLEREWRAEQEREQTAARVEGNGGASPSKADETADRLRGLFSELGLQSPTQEELASE